MNKLKTYFKCVKIALAQASAYRSDFIINIILTIISNLLFPLVTILIYANGTSFPGWTMWEVFVIQSIFTLSQGIAAMISNSVLWVTMDHIRNGSFETILLKPVSPLFYIIATNFSITNVGLVLEGLVMLIVSLSFTGIGSIFNIIHFIILFICGICVICGLNLIIASISFKWVGNSRLREINETIQTFAKYPATIFPQILKITLSLIIPVGMIAFFPAEVLLGRTDNLYFLPAILSVNFLVLGRFLYHHMIKLYEGVGG